MLRAQKRLAVALGSLHPAAMFVAAVVVGGSLLVALSMSQSIIRGASPILAFWSTTLTDVPAARASVATTFDINAALAGASANAPVQHASVIGCTYVLTDGHSCN